MAESRSACAPRAIRGSRLPVKIAAMSNPTAAMTTATTIGTRADGARAARRNEAAPPATMLVMRARWWPCVRSAQAATHGAASAVTSIATASVQAHTTPPGTPHGSPAKTTFSM